MSKGKSGRTRDRGRAANLFVVLVVTIGFCVPAQGQTISNRQLSKLHLPGPLRDQLVKRLDLFIEYEKTQSYDKQFELLAKEHLASLLHMDVNKESYVKFKQQTQLAAGRLLELRVKDVKRMPDKEGGLSFSVVAKLQKGKTIYTDSPILVAYLENGASYFSLLYIN